MPVIFGRRLRFSVLALAMLALSACAKSYSPDVYSPGGMQQANKVDRAVVVSVRQIDVNDPSIGVGTLAGAAGGGIAGSQIGAGGGNAIATLGGVLIGGAVGYLIDQEANSTTAYEYILEKQNGELMTLAQKIGEDQVLPPGTHVFILYGVKARVIKDEAPAVAAPVTPAKPGPK